MRSGRWERRSDPLDTPDPDAGLRSFPVAPESMAPRCGLRQAVGLVVPGAHWRATLVGLPSEVGRGRPALCPSSFSEGHRNP